MNDQFTSTTIVFSSGLTGICVCEGGTRGNRFGGKTGFPGFLLGLVGFAVLLGFFFRNGIKSKMEDSSSDSSAVKGRVGTWLKPCPRGGPLGLWGLKGRGGPMGPIGRGGGMFPLYCPLTGRISETGLSINI